MVVAELTIVVDSCDPTKGLIPGQLISGRVICHSEQPKDFEHLTLTFSGFGHVHWTEHRHRSTGSGKDHQTESYTIYYNAHESYFEYSTLLAGGGQGSHELPAGGTTFPFQVVFPGNIPGLPCSFEGSVAHVRYQLFAHLKRGLFKSDSRIEQRFAYNAPYDLNALPETQFIRGPRELQNEKFLGCCCCKSGPISMRVAIPKQGFVPGEYLNFRGHFVNNSNSTIEHVMVQLHLVGLYHAYGEVSGGYGYGLGGPGTRMDSYVMASAKSNPIESRKDVHWEGALLIPEGCPPTNLGVNSKIINVSYAIEFIMVPKRKCSKNLTAQLPITIGTVPLEIL